VTGGCPSLAGDGAVRRGLALWRGLSLRGGGCPLVKGAVPLWRGMALREGGWPLVAEVGPYAEGLAPCGGDCPLREGAVDFTPLGRHD
jgi:hypothetical protein